MTVEAESDDTRIPSSAAREWWRGLMSNVVALLEDAASLNRNGSRARSHSLTILALEELAKAQRLYDSVNAGWTAGHAEVAVPEHLLGWKSHPEKLASGLQFSEYLPSFWGKWIHVEIPDAVDGGFTRWFEEQVRHRASEARALDLAKQSGFYVDRAHDGLLTSPMDTPPDAGTVKRLHEQVAGAAEMLLITDHSRMKLQMPPTAYDSTHDLQHRLLDFSHPGMFTQDDLDRGAP